MALPNLQTVGNPWFKFDIQLIFNEAAKHASWTWLLFHRSSQNQQRFWVVLKYYPPMGSVLTSNSHHYNHSCGRAQAVRCWLLTADVRFNPEWLQVRFVVDDMALQQDFHRVSQFYQTAHYYTLSPKLGASCLTRHVAGLGVKVYLNGLYTPCFYWLQKH
jgi:hypothetical protein